MKESTKINLLRAALVVVLLVSLRVAALYVLNDTIISTIAITTRQPSLCTPLHFLKTSLPDRIMNGTDAWKCYEAAAIALDRPEVCLSVNYGGDAAVCFTHFAVAKKNLEYCDWIDGTFELPDCYRKLIDMGVVGEDACNLIAANKPRNWGAASRSICKYGPLEGISGPDICEKMESSFYRDNCFQHFGLL